MGARRLISGTGSKRFTGARGVENVGRRTRSGPMETVRPGKRRSDSLEVSSRETEKISLSHDAKQVRYTCNIRPSLSHEVKQARYGSDGVRPFADMYLHPVRNSLLCCILLSLSRTDFRWVWLFMAFVHRTQFGCIGQPSPDDFCPDLYDDTR